MTGPTAEPESAVNAAPKPAMRRLHLNESPMPPATAVIDAVVKAAGTLHLYPQEAASGLVEALARYAGVTADRVFLTDGSSELLYLLPYMAGAMPGSEVVLPHPTFPVFAKMAELNHLGLKKVPVTASGIADVDNILAAISDKTVLVCVPTPNNPTGGIISHEDLSRLCEAMPPHVLFHLDEAYYEFGREAGGPETLPLLARVKGRWLSSRSASKAFGLAGLRLGYAIASDAEFAAACRDKRPLFNVNAVALAAGLAAIEHAHESLNRVAVISRERERVAMHLDALGLASLPSGANFIAFHTGGLGADPVRALAERGILVIGFEMADGTKMIRASIGTPEDNDALLLALADLRG